MCRDPHWSENTTVGTYSYQHKRVFFREGRQLGRKNRDSGADTPQFSSSVWCLIALWLLLVKLLTLLTPSFLILYMEMVTSAHTVYEVEGDSIHTLPLASCRRNKNPVLPSCAPGSLFKKRKPTLTTSESRARAEHGERLGVWCQVFLFCAGLSP